MQLFPSSFPNFSRKADLIMLGIPSTAARLSTGPYGLHQLTASQSPTYRHNNSQTPVSPEAGSWLGEPCLFRSLTQRALLWP